MLYTEFQCPTMPRTGLKVCVRWWVTLTYNKPICYSVQLDFSIYIQTLSYVRFLKSRGLFKFLM